MFMNRTNHLSTSKWPDSQCCSVLTLQIPDFQIVEKWSWCSLMDQRRSQVDFFISDLAFSDFAFGGGSYKNRHSVFSISPFVRSCALFLPLCPLV